MPATIIASNVLCAGGRGTEQLWATVRAGISCIKSSFVIDQYSDPIQMGLVPEDALAPLPPEFDAEALPYGARRMLQLAAPTLAAVADSAGPGPITLYLGLPQIDSDEAPWLEQFPLSLGKFSDLQIDPATSRIFPNGRASVLVALEAGLKRLTENPASALVVGGVDTFLDLHRIATLDSEARILGARVMDGFIPGEGAAFFVLKHGSAAVEGTKALIHGAASVADPGHRYGKDPALGEGLANALEKLRRDLPVSKPVATTFAGFNGENFDAKLWGVARLRHNDFFTSDMVMQHPADSIGDTGAAAGAILIALAAYAISNAQREGSVLLWAASDHDSRGCALLST